MIESLRDKSANVRFVAIMAAGAMGDAVKDALPALVQALGDAEPRVSQETVSVLAGIGRPALPALIEALTSSDKAVRTGAAKCILRMGTSAHPGIPGLKKSLGRGKLELPDEDIEEIKRLFKNGNDEQ